MTGWAEVVHEATLGAGPGRGPQLLGTAARLLAARRGGFGPGGPPTWAGWSAYPPAPDHPPPGRRLLPAALAERILRLPAALAAEVAAQAGSAGYVVPTGLLPAWVSAASRSPAFATGAAELLGERGRWLAATNAQWARAAKASAVATGASTPEDRAVPWARGEAEAALDQLLNRMRAGPPDPQDQRLTHLLALRTPPGWVGPRLDDVLALVPGHSRWRPLLVVAADLADVRHRLEQEHP